MSFLDPIPETQQEIQEKMHKELSRKPRHPAVKYYLTMILIIALLFPIYSPFYTGEHDGILPPYQYPFILFFFFSLFWLSHLLPYRITNPIADEMEIDALHRAQKIALPINMIIILSLCIWCAAGAAYDIPRPDTKRDWTSVGFSLMLILPLMPYVIVEWITPIVTEADEA